MLRMLTGTLLLLACVAVGCGEPGDAALQIDGIFTPNESTTHGMLNALRSQGLAGDVAFVGFDASTTLVDALEAGEIDALTVQNPTRMGYAGVMAVVRHLQGEAVADVDTGVVVVTRSGMAAHEALLGEPKPVPDVPELVDGRSYSVAVIPKGESHAFWKSVHAGANEAKLALAAQGIEVNVIWGGPDKEDDVTSQKQMIERRVSQGVDGIVLAPLHDQAMVDKVEEAMAAGVPVVIIDSEVNTDKRIAYIATNNEQGGYLAGKHLCELLGGKGRVAMLRYMENSASTEAREAGFLRALKEYPQIRIVSDNQHGGATAASAQTAASALLTRFSK